MGQNNVTATTSPITVGRMQTQITDAAPTKAPPLLPQKRGPFFNTRLMVITCVASFYASWMAWAWAGDLQLAILLAQPLYLIPSYVAWRRHHLNTLSILLLNIFLGWTGLGWIAALIWATYRRRQ
jgi:hypothetical protein